MFLGRFYDKYRGQSSDQALETLVRGIRPTPLRVAVVYRSVRPKADMESFSVFLKRACAGRRCFDSQDLNTLYVKYGPDKFSLADRGYLARVHPLELWVLEYLDRHPRAALAEVLTQSTAERQEVYRWLFRPTRWEGQNKRIRILMEEDAFREIGESLAAVGISIRWAGAVLCDRHRRFRRYP